MGKCRKFVLTRDFSCIVRRGRKYLGVNPELTSNASKCHAGPDQFKECFMVHGNLHENSSTLFQY